jgi:hypothetical protein
MNEPPKESSTGPAMPMPQSNERRLSPEQWRDAIRYLRESILDGSCRVHPDNMTPETMMPDTPPSNTSGVASCSRCDLRSPTSGSSET